jgi:hypothetical protein
VYLLVAVLAGLAQLMVLAATFFMGLGWGGPTWVAGLVQAGAGVVLVVRLGGRRSWWVVAVPVLSALLTVGLVMVAEQYAAATECSDQETQAFARLRPPVGLDMELEGDMNNGCMARGYTRTPPETVVTHYAEQLRENGWSIRTGQGRYLEADLDGLRIVVEAVPAEGGLVLISVFEPSDAS